MLVVRNAHRPRFQSSQIPIVPDAHFLANQSFAAPSSKTPSSATLIICDSQRCSSHRSSWRMGSPATKYGRMKHESDTANKVTTVPARQGQALQSSTTCDHAGVVGWIFWDGMVHRNSLWWRWGVVDWWLVENNEKRTKI